MDRIIVEYELKAIPERRAKLQEFAAERAYMIFKDRLARPEELQVAIDLARFSLGEQV